MGGADAGGPVEADRGTHLDGVRRHFLEHLSDEELDALGGIWERMLPDTMP